MARIVMKFGGTSVANLDRIRRSPAGCSASTMPGGASPSSSPPWPADLPVRWGGVRNSPRCTTPANMTRSSQPVSPSPGLLAIALQQIRVEARSWQGWQIPIQTDTAHAKARIMSIDASDLIERMGGVGMDRDLPALPGAGLDADFLQRDGEQAGGHLLTGCDDRVIFAGVMQGRKLLAPADQLVGRAGHGGDDDGDLVADRVLALHPAGDLADAVQVGDRSAAEFHHDTRHVVLFLGLGVLGPGNPAGGIRRGSVTRDSLR